MTLLLLDLDDTLIGNPMERFVPAYLKGLAGRMAPAADPDMLIKVLLEATRHMVEDTDPGLTLEEKFDSVFFPGLDLDRFEVQALIDTFYKDDFPGLASLTRPFPAATRLVAQAISQGDRVAIATNPLFPRTAILQRLAWAGLPPEQVPFVIIPSYETFHFGKPNPAYFAELLAQVGWPEEPVVMVGDDPRMDIEPARKLGLPVFWIANPATPWPGSAPEPPRGSLDDILPWLDSQPATDLLPKFDRPAALTAILRSSPAALATLLAGRLPSDLTFHPQPGEWSVTEVLCHLRDVEREVNLVRLEKAMEINNPFIAGQDTDQWALERQYIQQDCFDAQEAFLQARMKLIAIVESLTEADWGRSIRHAIFGPTSLAELINIIARHDRLHVNQVLQALRAIPPR